MVLAFVVHDLVGTRELQVDNYCNNAVWLWLILDIYSAVFIYMLLKYWTQLGKERFELKEWFLNLKEKILMELISVYLYES